MRLLPGGRICITSRREAGAKFFLHETSASEATTHIPPVNFPALIYNQQPFPKWQFGYNGFLAENISQPYCCDNTNTSRLVFNTRKAIYGIMVPGPGDVAPKIIKLMDFSSELKKGSSGLSLGYNSAIGNDGTSPVRILYYSWPDDSGSPGPSNSLTVRPGMKCWKEDACPSSDEGSGRVVVVERRRGREEILVYDFSDIPKCF